MRIEFLIDYLPYTVGQVVKYEHAGAAEVLVSRGIAKPAAVKVNKAKPKPTVRMPKGARGDR